MLSVLIAAVFTATAGPMPDCLPDCLPDIVVASQPAPLVDAVLPILDKAPPLPATKPKQVLVIKPPANPPANTCPGGNCSRPTYSQPRRLFGRWR